MINFKKIPKFCISLPLEKKRRDWCLKMKDLLKLKNFQFVNAVDFRETDFTEEFKAFRPTLGCLMSHYKVFQHALDNGLKEIMVFEDDFCCDGDYEKNFNQYISNIPNDYDLVLFGNRIEGVSIASKNVLKINGNFLLAHAYIINKKLMIEYIDFIKYKIINNKLIHADVILSDLCIVGKLNVYHPSESLIKQMSFPSSNQHKPLSNKGLSYEIKMEMIKLTEAHELF
jgi:GR25 family glycosyltransferase involved in LPS biosynthesis